MLPADATNPAVTYTSADATIATVDANGLVTGVAAGNTTITIAATDGSNVTATINVSVANIDVTEITASDVTMITGETATISYTVTPSNATDSSVTFTSANPAIATVDASGKVKGVANGTATITATYTYRDGKKTVKATYKVTVELPTDITGLTSDTQHPTPDNIYTLDGRYVGTSKETLPSGIYIQKGKKFTK